MALEQGLVHMFALCEMTLLGDLGQAAHPLQTTTGDWVTPGQARSPCFSICHSEDGGGMPVSSSIEGAPVSPAAPGFQLRGPASPGGSSNPAGQPGPCAVQV